MASSITRESKQDDTSFYVQNVLIGSKLTIIASLCTIDDESQSVITAHTVQSAGAHILRCGTNLKMSPHNSSAGWTKRKLEILTNVRAETRMPVIIEVVDPRNFTDSILSVADIVQVEVNGIGHSSLVTRAGETGKPVLITRGQGVNIRKWLSAAEHLSENGSGRIILCAQKVLTVFCDKFQSKPDLESVPYLRQKTHVPIFFDPSHSVNNEIMGHMALAAVAAGAQGIMVDVSTEALCNGVHALNSQDFRSLVLKVQRLYDVIAVPPEIEFGVLDFKPWPLSATSARPRMKFYGATSTVTLTRVEITRRKDFAFPGYDITAMSPSGPVIGYFKESGEGWIRSSQKVGLY